MACLATRPSTSRRLPGRCEPRSLSAELKAVSPCPHPVRLYLKAQTYSVVNAVQLVFGLCIPIVSVGEHWMTRLTGRTRHAPKNSLSKNHIRRCSRFFSACWCNRMQRVTNAKAPYSGAFGAIHSLYASLCKCYLQLRR